MLLPTCVVLLQAAHTFCVSVLYVHVVFDDKHVLMRVRTRVCSPQIYLSIYLSIYLYIILIFLMLIMGLFLGLLVSISTWFV